MCGGVRSAKRSSSSVGEPSPVATADHPPLHTLLGQRDGPPAVLATVYEKVTEPETTKNSHTSRNSLEDAIATGLTPSRYTEGNDTVFLNVLTGVGYVARDGREGVTVGIYSDRLP